MLNWKKKIVLCTVTAGLLACGGGGGDGGGGGETPQAPTPNMNIQSVTGGDVNISSGTGTDSFGSAQQGTNGNTIQYRLQNTGTAALTLTATSPNFVAISGTDAGHFTVLQQPTSSSLSAGSAGLTGLTFSIQFNPVLGQLGTKSATVTIANNSPGKNPYTFVISGISTSAPVPEINIQKMTGGTANVIHSTGSYTFANATENTSGANIEFRIQNLGAAALNLTGTPFVSLSGANANQFVVTQPPVSSIAAGGNSQFFIQFMPTSTGTKNATVSVSSNDSDENPYTFTISGVGTSPEINVQKITGGTANIAHGTGSYAFATTAENTSGPTATFKIQNLGTNNLTLNGTAPNYVVLTGTDASQFVITSQPAVNSIGTGATGTTGLDFIVQFMPTSAGAKTATVSIANSDADENPYTFTVTGTGYTPAPEIHVEQGGTGIASGGSYGYAATRVGTSTSVTFTIRNQGTSVLNLSGSPVVSIGGTDASMFSIALQPAATVAASGSVLFSMSFLPTSTGAKTASLSIANNDSNENPYVINLTGTGTEPSAPCITIANGNVISNAGTIPNFYGTGVTGYYSSMISTTVGPANPVMIYFARQPIANANAILANLYSAMSSYNPFFETKGGIGERNFAFMYPYGTTTSEFLNYNGTTGALPTLVPSLAQNVFIDFTSPVSLSVTNMSYSIVRGCEPRLAEEMSFVPAAVSANTNGLAKVWTYRKKLNVRLIFVQGTYPTSTVAGIQQAVDRMTSIYAQNSVKIDLQFSTASITASEFQALADLDDQTGTLAGSLTKLFVTNPGAAQSTQALNLYVTGSETQVGGVLGISSGIPGVPGINAQAKAGMVVFIEGHRSSGTAGSALSVSDLQFLGDTMAHEAGHYLGLFHTNERAGYDAAANVASRLWGGAGRDALIETPYCNKSNDNNPADGMLSIAECSGAGFTNSGSLNLMFWVGDGVTAQTQLTGEQGWLLRANPLVY